MNKEIAQVCAGSFWVVQLKFSKVRGVVKSVVGYEGGNLPYPTYTEVLNGSTGHVETVEVTFDMNIISYEEILEEFWKMHDPTSLAQKDFIGNQYKSTIFYLNDEQKEIAEKSKIEAQNLIEGKIITDIKKATSFYIAEDMHQYYFLKQRN